MTVIILNELPPSHPFAKGVIIFGGHRPPSLHAQSSLTGQTAADPEPDAVGTMQTGPTPEQRHVQMLGLTRGMQSPEFMQAADALMQQQRAIRTAPAVLESPVQAEVPADAPVVPLLRLWPHLRALTRQRWPDPANLQRLAHNQTFLSDLHRIEPALLWLGWRQVLEAEAFGWEQPARSARPVRALRQALTGVGKKAWIRLLQHSPAEFPCDARGVHAHVLREQLVDRPLPTSGPVHAWMSAFDVRPGAGSIKLAHQALPRVVARTLALQGVERIADGSWDVLNTEELPLILSWLEVFPGLKLGKRFGYAALLRRARHWQMDRDARQAGVADRWTCPAGPWTFEDWQVRPLPDRFSMWQEGVHMHHCIGTYADQCRTGYMRVFHVHPLAGGIEWTLALVRTKTLEWRVHDIRGVANRIPHNDARTWAGAFAKWYGTVEQIREADADEDTSDDEDEDPADTRCPICRLNGMGDEESYCDAHLVAAIDEDEGILGGTVYEEWNEILARLKDEVFDALVGGRRDTGRGSEMESVVEQIREAGFDWRSWDTQAEAEGRSPDPEHARETFDELCADLGVDRTIRLYMEEVLGELPVDQRYFEISSAPGLTWVGNNYWALDAAGIAEQFIAAFK